MKFWQKKQGYDKSVWLDWLNDDGPTTAAPQKDLSSPKPQQQRPQQVRSVWSGNIRSRDYQAPRPRSARPDIGERQSGVVRNGPTASPRQVVEQTPVWQLWSKPKPQPQQPSKSQPEGAKEIHINLTLPSIKKLASPLASRVSGGIDVLRAKIANIGFKRVAYVIGAAPFVLVLAFIGMRLLDTDDAPKVAGSSTTEVVKQTKPTYDPVAPAGRTDADVKPLYDEKRKVTSYKDKIGYIEVTVSQQPLPAAFKKAPQTELKKLAESFAATTVLELDNGEKAYLGTSAKGPQTAISVYGDLLVFIMSEKEVSKTQWTDYINSLQ